MVDAPYIKIKVNRSTVFSLYDNITLSALIETCRNDPDATLSGYDSYDSDESGYHSVELLWSSLETDEELAERIVLHNRKTASAEKRKATLLRKKQEIEIAERAEYARLKAKFE